MFPTGVRYKITTFLIYIFMTFCHLVMDYVPDHFMSSHRFHFTVFLSFRLSVKQITQTLALLYFTKSKIRGWRCNA